MNPSFDPSQIPLRDIHLPEPIAWWPPAFGWWVFAAGALMLSAALLIRYARQRRHRAAYGALDAVVAKLRGGGDPAECAQEVSTILRRFAMTMSDEPSRVAGLAGERWLRYLDGSWDRQAFHAGAGRCLLCSPYEPAGRVRPEDAMELCALSRSWVKAQRARS